MKFSEQWLREWVNPPITTDKLIAQLTNAGLEVTNVMPVAAQFTGVVVAEIIQVDLHPNAERLRICQVNIGQQNTVTILTNEITIQAGMKVAAALVGAHLPGLDIKLATLRGVDSFGMFCSAKTLGISDNDNSLLQLAKDAPAGKDLRDYLQLNDHIIDIELTPNRGDCLSIIGIAREVAVANQQRVNKFSIKPVAAVIEDQITVQVNAPAACPHYVARVIRNINSQAQTPLWLQEKLRRSGLHSIHPVVDVINYVMLELGQPMHAFDLNAVGEKITVEYAGHVGKDTLLLNDEKRDLCTNTLTIKNAFGTIVAIAGIMGAMQGSITVKTTDIVLESAFFTPLNLLGKARQYGLHTDSSHRFERGVDPQLPIQAIERATELLLAIVGGQPGPRVEKTSVPDLPASKTIMLRATSIKRLLGCTIPAEKIVTILSGLSMQVKTVANGWQVIPPSFRFDIEIEVDLIEELARIYGYDNIPKQLPLLTTKLLPPINKLQFSTHELRLCLKNRGYHEAITYSFVDNKLQTLLDTQHNALPLVNPISADLAVMRTTLWASLLPVLIYNQKRQQPRVRLFEIGLRFIEQDGQLQQISTIAGLVWGSVTPEQWGAVDRNVDFYDIKGDIEALFAGVTLTFTATDYSAVHQGRSAQINLHDNKIGYVGALHPEIEQKLGVSGVYGFEVDLTTIVRTALSNYKAIAKFPAIRRDLAIIVSANIKAAEIYNEIQETAGNLLNQLILFDIYKGEAVPAGQKSMALGLILQAPDRTLIDGEVKLLISTIIDKLKKRFAVILRE